MTAAKIRDLYKNFFVEHKHAFLSGRSLIPENDPSVLFITAGMHPLVPYLLGQPHSQGKRLINYQRCLRTGDIDEVGDSSHLTFFEMLGNWSLGDYFKEESIAMSHEFLTSDRWLNLPPEKLHISVFEGDEDVPSDTESIAQWKRWAIPDEHIHRLPRKDNWWGPVGLSGPCGPDTEIFFDTQNGLSKNFPGSRYLEIWNNVFMEYNRSADGHYQRLDAPCVDTGMGLERTCAVLQGKKDIYEIELLLPIIRFVEQHSAQNTLRFLRIITDHIRSASFIIADGVLPSNLGRGYVLRRLLRRAIRCARLISFHDPKAEVVDIIATIYKDVYPILYEKKELIQDEITSERTKFEKTLERGEKEFEKIVLQAEKTGEISGSAAFHLYDTFGFPLELTEELAREKGFRVDTEGFNHTFSEHREKSRMNMDHSFKGGLADNAEATTKLHTATHLLHQALREVLGNHVQQKGSNITQERLRFDFSHDEKMTDEEIAKVQETVNKKISANLPVHRSTLLLTKAKEEGALAFFTEKYDELVSMYSIGNYSKEICGGPHVKNTGELEKFTILKEQSSSRGVRRIKAVLTPSHEKKDP